MQKNNLDNVVVFETAAERLEGIPQSSVDRAAMILTLHHLEDRIRAFKNVRRVLKPDGALYIFDPIASRMLGHGTNPEKIIKELAVSGFRHDGFSISKGFLFWTVTARPKTEVPEVGGEGNTDSVRIRRYI